MSSHPKNKIPILAILGIGLGLFYFFSGKASTKQVHKRLDSISNQSHESGDKTVDAIIELKEVIDNNPSAVLEEMKEQQAFETLEKEEEERAVFNQMLMQKWKDEEGKPTLYLELPAEFEALMSESKDEQIIDISNNKKKTNNASLVQLISFDSTEINSNSPRFSEMEERFFLARWFNNKK